MKRYPPCHKRLCFGAPGAGRALVSLLLCCVRSAHKVSKLPVFYLELTLLTFSDSFHIIEI